MARKDKKKLTIARAGRIKKLTPKVDKKRLGKGQGSDDAKHKRTKGRSWKRKAYAKRLQNFKTLRNGKIVYLPPNQGSGK